MLVELMPDLVIDPGQVIASGLVLMVVVIGLLNWKLYRVLRASPRLKTVDPQNLSLPTLGVIVPAYNEARNVVDCLSSILDSTTSPIEVWLVDDDSSDPTWDLAQSVAASRQDTRLHLLKGQPRPSDQRWVGKNWACAQAAEQVKTDYLLFLDCDVRLSPGAIEAALQHAQTTQVGLLSVGPEIICGCLAEWLVQPIMMAILAVGYDLAAVNDPHRREAFAFGPFMLFQRPAYEQVGGHRAVADQVVEDVELARRIKKAGLGLGLCLGRELVQTRMYADGASLWEGWTKNWFLGLGKSWPLATLMALGLLGVCVGPWLGLLLGSITTDPLWISLSLVGISGQWAIRLLLNHWAHLSLRYWWLTGAGGLVAASIVLASAYRTSTGSGWTWRGRSLKSVG